MSGCFSFESQACQTRPFPCKGCRNKSAGQRYQVMFDKEDLISVYSTRQAVEDGMLVEVDRGISQEAGIRFPVLMTRAVWDRYVEVPDGLKVPQDLEGRLWDVLSMFRLEAQKAGSASDMRFSLYVVMARAQEWLPNESRASSRLHRMVMLKAVIQARDFDDLSPAIFIMTPQED